MDSSCRSARGSLVCFVCGCPLAEGGPGIARRGDFSLTHSLPTLETRTNGPLGKGLQKAPLRSGCVNTAPFQPALRALARAFEEPFALVDVESGDLLHAGFEGLCCDLSSRMELLAEVARRGKPEIVEEVAPLSMLAVPFSSLRKGTTLVAVGVFVHQRVSTEEQIAAAARSLGVDAQRALRWSEGCEIWLPRVLLHMAESVLENLVQQNQVSHLRHEINEAVAHARDTYVELGLLHRLATHLLITEDELELWPNALAWLADSIQAQCLAIVSNQALGEDSPLPPTDYPTGVLTHGECPTGNVELRHLLEQFGSTALRQPFVLNRAETALPTWPCPTVRELACVPINGGEQPLGWLLALNHKGRDQEEPCQFGSVETRLLSSVGTILGIHSSNLGLYKKQSELFTSSVRALATAIDAKDSYTSGHSDRVARASVTLAKHFGLDKETQDIIYLGGLLHDIGKIGIDDHILNKPGSLTTEEYKHVKQHPQLGHEILKGVRQLDRILPIVLHHHEAWDGGGYPQGLQGAEIPLLARIVAVADALDAMTSDRPYRKGIPDDEIDAILRKGAGSQWDSEVIEAFFAVQEEIRDTMENPSSDYSLDNAHWLN